MWEDADHIGLDLQVVEAMNQINAERRLRLAAEEKAEGNKILVIKAAEADAESKYLSGVGLAKRRSAIIAGLKVPRAGCRILTF